MTLYEQGIQTFLSPNRLARMGEITLAAFGGVVDPDASVLGVTDDVVLAPNLAACMRDPQNFVVVNTDEGDIKAFDLAVPTPSMDPTAVAAERAAYLYLTAVDPANRGQGRIWPTHHALFEVLRSAGYVTLDLDAILVGGYAARMQNRYGNAMTKTGPVHDNWGFGWQLPCRVDLEKYFSVPRGI
jgi:hypothetical protein